MKFHQDNLMMHYAVKLKHSLKLSKAKMIEVKIATEFTYFNI